MAATAVTADWRGCAARSTMLDLEIWGRRGGVLVEDPADVVEAVAESLADPSRHGDMRRAMARDLFYNPGRATAAAVACSRARSSEADHRAERAC